MHTFSLSLWIKLWDFIWAEFTLRFSECTILITVVSLIAIHNLSRLFILFKSFVYITWPFPYPYIAIIVSKCHSKTIQSVNPTWKSHNIYFIRTIAKAGTPFSIYKKKIDKFEESNSATGRTVCSFTVNIYKHTTCWSETISPHVIIHFNSFLTNVITISSRPIIIIISVILL